MEALKAEMQKLLQQRSAIESEIQDRTNRLNAPGQPGMTGSLLDKEGFPRSDIDVAAVRSDRQAIIRLTNDHKALSGQLEQLLHKVHALARETGAAAVANSQQAASNTAAAAAPPPPPAGAAAAPAATSTVEAVSEPSDQPGDNSTEAQPEPAAAASAAAAPAAAAAADVGSLRPFAVVDEVAEHSPAAAAGIHLGDQLCRFGAAIAGSGSELQQVSQELQAHEGQAVQVVFLRAGQAVQLQLVPRRWEGRGLLGCHLRPL